MVDNYCFKNVLVGSDGYVVRIDNGVDSISADYSYAVFEFSMGKATHIREIEERFHKYYDVLYPFFRERGYSFTGFGSHQFYVPFEDETQYT